MNMLLTKSFATRRMWVKRIRNTFIALRFLGIVFLPIFWLYSFFRWYAISIITRSIDEIIGGTIAIAIPLGIVFVERHNAKLATLATADEIIALRKADSCFDDTIVRRAAEWKRPLTIRDIRQTKEDCAKYWEKQKNMQLQAEALANQLRQPKN